MDREKVLIADNDASFRNLLARELEKNYQVCSCGTGEAALELLRTGDFSILVMDLLLQELDGLGLLQVMNTEGIRPKVLVLSSCFSDFALSSANGMGISYFIPKPCGVPAAVRQVEALIRFHGRSGQNLRREISAALLGLGLSAKHNGYAYLREAIARMIDDPEQSVTKELYPAVAAVCGCDGKQVERSIRHALDAAWKQRDEALWQRYFPGASKRPTNAAFIARLAESLRLELE